MGLKKYEIITVGSVKRVRALRSWQVGDRYVNIGDVGGIVYDEKTLSQDGLCWLFRGNFGFPGARIGGDSIVDVGEATLSAAGTPAVDILGSSVVVGSKLQLESEQTAADAVVLTAADFEQGTYGALIAGTPLTKVDSGNYVRLKNPFFAGGKTVTLKCIVPGYSVTAVALDRDGNIITNAPTTSSGVGVTITVPAGQYFTFRMSKDPIVEITLAEATSAQITFTGTYETKLSVIDSRVEISPATAKGTATIRPGGVHTIGPGIKYPDSVIRNSKVVINGHATANRVVRLMSEFIGCNVAIDATLDNAQSVGIYSNVKNLTFTGAVSSDSLNVNVPGGIQATDCDNFAVSPTTFPGLISARPVNMPFIFQGCNVPNGRFYHHAQIANTYKNIDFAKASVDLGKTLAGNREFASSEVEGLYRLVTPASGLIGCLVESFASVEKLAFDNFATAYNTTIYKDAYFNGLFAIAGTNVFGNKVRSHPLAQVLNVQPRAVQGMFNTVTVGGTITGVVANANHVCVPLPFRVNGAIGLKIDNMLSGVNASFIYVNPGNNVVIATTGWSSGNSLTPSAGDLKETRVFIQFRKSSGKAITPEDLAGVTVTVYNGCKIVNTGATVVNMKGSIRVEDNATLVNASVIGTGYFGGNAVMSGMNVNGYAYMKDNAICTKTSENVQTFASLAMEGNAVYNSIASLAHSGLNVFMYDNSKVLGDLRSAAPVLIMRDNATITAAGSLSGACLGTVTIKDNAVINTSISTIGDITLCGDYVSVSNKTWTGKRTITDVNEPEYDNNVKTQYDF